MTFLIDSTNFQVSDIVVTTETLKDGTTSGHIEVTLEPKTPMDYFVQTMKVWVTYDEDSEFKYLDEFFTKTGLSYDAQYIVRIKA